MLAPADYDRLVSQFYAAAAGDLAWTAALGTLSSLFRVERNVINIADARWRTVAVEAHGKPADHAADYYAGEIYKNDPRMHCLQKLPSGTVYYDHMLFDLEAMERNPWCQEAYRALEVKYQLGIVFDLPEGLIGAFAMLPSEREGHATEAAIAAFRRVAPHIEQAASLGLVMEKAATTRSALLDALSRKAEGVILLNRAGAPTFVNDAAQAILDARDGLGLARGAFVTRRLPETRRIAQLVQGALAPATGQPGGRVLVSRPSGKSPYVLSVMPAPPVERFLAGASIGCIVHLQDLAAVRLPSHEALREVFGLSDREADLAIELVRCASLDRAAANARMALNTARNHLQSISRKTGARGQAELVRLLGRLD
ncbi:MAG: helix-turn-helix transcriptional regulator [Phenylobacterium sp.]